jgi:hypothetical protein
MANDEISTPKIPSSGFPINRKANIITKATIVAFPAWILPVFFLISIMIGMEPGISIIANNTINDANISTMLKFIIRLLYFVIR